MCHSEDSLCAGGCGAQEQHKFKAACEWTWWQQQTRTLVACISIGLVGVDAGHNAPLHIRVAGGGDQGAGDCQESSGVQLGDCVSSRPVKK